VAKRTVEKRAMTNNKHSGEMYLLWKMCRLQQERAGSTG